MRITRITPIAIVEAIEPSVPFWEAAGMAVVASVPHGDRLGFVILAGEAGQLMLQTRDSLAEDLPPVAALSPLWLTYVDVDFIAATAAAIQGQDVIVPLRSTFYGAQEIWVRTSEGAVIGYAESPAGAEA